MFDVNIHVLIIAKDSGREHFARDVQDQIVEAGSIMGWLQVSEHGSRCAWGIASHHRSHNV